MNLSATPGRPACPSRASGWSSLTPPWGLPCCVRFPCVHAVATTPAQRLGVLLRSFSPAVSAFPERVAGSACASSFSRFARRSLALRPAHSRRHQFVTRYPEGFSHFVTSMTAPVASGWSVRRVGLAPTGKRRLSTAHTLNGPFSLGFGERCYGNRALFPRSVRFEAGEPDHLAPLFGLFGNELCKFAR